MHAIQAEEQVVAVLMPKADDRTAAIDPLATGAMLVIRESDGLRSLHGLAEAERHALTNVHVPVRNPLQILDVVSLDLLSLNEFSSRSL